MNFKEIKITGKMPWFEQKMGTFRAGLVIGHVEGKMCMFYRHKQGEKRIIYSKRGSV